MTIVAPFLLAISEGIADLLAPQGFGWRDPTATHPLYAARLPNVANGGPAHAVALTAIPLGNDPALAQSETRLSFLMRSASSDITDLWTIEAALTDGLAGNYPVTLSTGVQITSIAFRTSGALMTDDGNRWLFTADYVISAGRPTPHRH